MNKTILITGISGNLGSAVADNLQEEGNHIIGVVRPGGKKIGLNVQPVECDLTSETSVNEMFDDLKQKWKKMDAALLLVGGFTMGDLQSTSGKDLSQMLDLNLMTAFHSARAAYQWMKTTGGGKIIMVGSRTALEKPAAQTLAYTLSKSAVIRLAEMLNESGKKDNIQVSVIVPGIIDTPQNRLAMPQANSNEWVKPQQIAEIIKFLLSQNADPLRETVLKVYGES